MQENMNVSPFNALPQVVVGLVLAIAGVELVFQAAQAGMLGGALSGLAVRIWALEQFAVFGPGLELAWLRGQLGPLDALRFVAYPFVHQGFMHMLFPIVFVLALGKFVGEVFAGWAVLAVFFGASVFGALVYLLLSDPIPLYGSYPGAFGLIGAYTYILWIGLGARGQNQYQAFTLIGILMGLQLIFGLLFGSDNHWVAELAGFLAGFALSTLVSPGGWARFLRRLRERR